VPELRNRHRTAPLSASTAVSQPRPVSADVGLTFVAQYRSAAHVFHWARLEGRTPVDGPDVDRVGAMHRRLVRSTRHLPTAPDTRDPRRRGPGAGARDGSDRGLERERVRAPVERIDIPVLAREQHPRHADAGRVQHRRCTEVIIESVVRRLVDTTTSGLLKPRRGPTTELVNRLSPGRAEVRKSGAGLPTDTNSSCVRVSRAYDVHMPPPPRAAVSGMRQVAAPRSLPIGIVQKRHFSFRSPHRRPSSGRGRPNHSRRSR